MSRCYPYPPPGYQKKAQQPEVSAAAPKAPQKEKHKSKDKEKEKKGKDSEKDKDKEKKDKEKKDREKKDREKKDKDRDKDKEKKDKDKSKDKDRRDKDKRDKDKDKEKEKDNDKESKREKRKKDVETNGTSHGDKDPRSSKLQRTEVLHSTEENGRVREIKTTAAVVARPLDRDGKDAAKALDKDGKDGAKPLDRDGKDAAKPRGSVGGPATRPSSMYSKEQHQPNGKVDRTLPPIVLSKPVTGDSPPAVKVEEAAPSSRPSNHNHHIDSNNSGSHRPSKLPDFSVCDTMPQRTSWSAIDDEEWLSPSSEQVHQKPKAKVEEDTPQQVWADPIYLESVEMYALPYVVPY
ncbi:hypothetical protein MPTK1_3g15600 [Marchantia polymorpha subsp. ruderalis]|uniref:Uncharacterized protein n=2 Tax=Marchantia polymorpha TaxID=3197 RepID=A0AAF6B156_MARPO|nr:hypothetical protein MARPO_0004s0112 [Marchantia polymorpha]BBN05740.1 hypothetical protein Mp_3g15600 [Marchantia polymorpha subsp. ruderalis]|eukprot:PTQ48839.1 hypothetical protein MARPO_0004s0112 [Marchantia polymorpha]